MCRSCTCVLRGQSGDGLCKASILCKYDGMNGDLFTMGRRSALVSDVSDVLIEYAVVVYL